jgi:predicted AAA+ superfamily ATPase
MFESFIVSELLKMRFAQGKDSHLFFWRDQTGREIDIVVEKGSVILPVEVKAGQTFNPDFCKHLTYFKTLAHDVATGFVVYGGEKTEKRKDVQLVAWRDLDAELGRLI